MHQHALDVLQHVARANAQQLAFAGGGLVGLVGPLVECVDPFGDRGALVFAGVFEQVQCVARIEQRAPAVEIAARVEEFPLQVVELFGQQAPQLEVTVDHVVDHAQHQVGRARRHARTATRFGAGLLLRQAVREVLAHHAVGRVHGQQHAVEHREADWAGVDRGERCACAAGVALAGVDVRRRRAGACCEAAEHQQVVPGGVVEVRGQLVVQQVGDVQVDELPASPALQRGLQQHTVDLELAARAADPQVAAGGRFFGQGFAGGQCILSAQEVIAPGGSLILQQNANFLITGNLDIRPGTTALPNTIDKTDTLKVMAYNVLNYGDGCQGSLSTLNSYLKTIIQYTQPDLLSCEKMTAFAATATGAANYAAVITDSVLNILFPNRFAFATPTNVAGDTKMSCLFYNKQKLTFVKTETLLASVSDFDLYKLYYSDPNLTITHDTTFLYVIVNHTKSGSSSTIRDTQVSSYMTTLRNKFAYLPNVINMGDFNTANSAEAGYQSVIVMLTVLL